VKALFHDKAHFASPKDASILPSEEDHNVFILS